VDKEKSVVWETAWLDSISTLLLLPSEDPVHLHFTSALAAATETQTAISQITAHWPQWYLADLLGWTHTQAYVYLHKSLGHFCENDCGVVSSESKQLGVAILAEECLWKL